MIDKPGIYSISSADYHADNFLPAPSLSSSIAKVILDDCPAEAAFAHPKLNKHFEPEESGEYDLGTAAHSMLLEGGAGLAVIDPALYRSKPTKDKPEGNIPSGWTNDAIRAARDAARAEGKTPILPRQRAEIERMATIAKQAIETCPDLPGLRLSDGKAEQTLVWQEGEVWCRARPDWISNDRRIQISYKSTETSANPRNWVRTGLGIGFDLQEAFYLRGNRKSGGPEDSISIVLVQRNKAPYSCSLLGLDPHFLALANDKCEEAIGIWDECMRKGVWPGYANRVHWLELPMYERMKWGDRTGRDIDEIIDRGLQA